MVESVLASALTTLAAVALVTAAAWADRRSGRIPNRLVLTGALAGLACQMLATGTSGAAAALGGLALGIALLLPFYLIGAMGAGDVKLMGMVGVFLGPSGVLSAAVLTFFAGGVLAIVVALRSGTLGRALANVRTMLFGSLVAASATRRVEIVSPVASAGRLPYGVAIAAGTLLHLVLLRFGISIV